MFVLVELKDTVRVAPEDLHKHLDVVLRNSLQVLIALSSLLLR